MSVQPRHRHTGDTGDSLLARQIGDVNEGVVERGVDVSNAENKLALSDLRTERGGLRLSCDLLDLGGLHPKSGQSIQPIARIRTAHLAPCISQMHEWTLTIVLEWLGVLREGVLWTLRTGTAILQSFSVFSLGATERHVMEPRGIRDARRAPSRFWIRRFPPRVYLLVALPRCGPSAL